mmetsp:Transcript_44556/g.85226  ORF Transcript_44556/g.85226 Transcript_44556/m.85226 type:complete len:446 (+) Transcript_44556:2-1339(+)
MDTSSPSSGLEASIGAAISGCVCRHAALFQFNVLCQPHTHCPTLDVLSHALQTLAFAIATSADDVVEYDLRVYNALTASPGVTAALANCLRHSCTSFQPHLCTPGSGGGRITMSAIAPAAACILVTIVQKQNSDGVPDGETRADAESSVARAFAAADVVHLLGYQSSTQRGCHRTLPFDWEAQPKRLALELLKDAALATETVPLLVKALLANSASKCALETFTLDNQAHMQGLQLVISMYPQTAPAELLRCLHSWYGIVAQQGRAATGRKRKSEGEGADLIALELPSQNDGGADATATLSAVVSHILASMLRLDCAAVAEAVVWERELIWRTIRNVPRVLFASSQQASELGTPSLHHERVDCTVAWLDLLEALAAWYSKCTPRSSDSTGAGLGALSAQTGQILVDVLLEQYTSLMTCQGHPCWHIRELADRLVEQIGRMKMHVLV